MVAGDGVAPRDRRGGGGQVLEKTTTGTEEKAEEAKEGARDKAEPIVLWGNYLTCTQV